VNQVNIDELKTLSKDRIPEAAASLSAADVNFLVEHLTEKADVLRYNAFLLLQANSPLTSQVYAH
jgi:hypothetical protein